MSTTAIKWAAAATLGLSAFAAGAAPVIFTGTDAGASSTDARPNSDAAARDFDVACRGNCSNSLITFESAPVASFTSQLVAPGVTLQAGSPAPVPLAIRNSPVGSPESVFGYNTTAAGANYVSVVGGAVEFLFDNPICAFGAYLTGVQLGGLTISFTDAAGAQTVAIPNVGSGAQFLGFTDFGVGGITKLTLNFQLPTTGDIVGIDDVRFCSNCNLAVPEPESWAIVLLGVAALGATTRRRRIGQHAA